MARIRSIKPEAFSSETLAGCSVHARWTFAGLWCYVDDDGRGRSNAGLVKAAVWPLDDDITPAEVGQFLSELEAARVICRYEVDGKSYLHVVNFPEHQHPNRPLASKLPACTRRTHGGLTESAVSTHSRPAHPPVAPLETNVEVKTAPEAPAHPEQAGQGPLSEDAVSAHGGRTTKSSSTPPTPLRNEQGVGDGDGKGDGVPPTAGAAKPRRSKPAPSEAHVGTVVAAFVDGATEAGLKAPPASLRARVGRQARQLLSEDWSIDFLIDSAKRMGAGSYDDLARQARIDDAAAKGVGNSSHSSAPPRQTNFTDEEYTSGW